MLTHCPPFDILYLSGARDSKPQGKLLLYPASTLANLLIPPCWAEKGDYNMYIAKLYSNMATPVSIISYTSHQNILDVKRYAISVASDFDIPGYDAIHRIEIYADDALVDTIVC